MHAVVGLRRIYWRNHNDDLNPLHRAYTIDNASYFEFDKAYNMGNIASQNFHIHHQWF